MSTTIENQMTEQPHRILFVITTLTFGGAETQLVHLAEQLRSRGHAVAVACLVRPVAWTEHLEQLGVPVHSLEMPRGIPDLRALWRLRHIVRSFNPTVVHAHMVHANLLCRFARLCASMPALVCTAHNLRETSERGGPTWHKELLYRLTDFLANETTIICQAAYDRYIRVGAVPRGKLSVVPNGVDTAKFSPSEEIRLRTRASLAVGNRFVWLAVGRLVEQKDYPNLLVAVSKLLNAEAVVLIAGQGPLASMLEEMSRRLNVSDRVRFLGARSDILDLYRAADGFVMSSEFEGLSAALLEAASVGLPSVVTHVGGNGEIVIDGSTGYLVPPASADHLAQAMERLMEMPQPERSQMGNAARKYCFEHYRFEAITDKWIALYNRHSRRVSQRSNAVTVNALETSSHG